MKDEEKKVTSTFIHWDIVNEIRDKLWPYGYGLADLHDGVVVLHTGNKMPDDSIRRDAFNIDERIIRWLCVTYGLVPCAAFFDTYTKAESGQICMGFCSRTRLKKKKYEKFNIDKKGKLLLC